MSDARPDPGAATRTMLALTAELMQSSFDVMGEGHILGTMPRYMERFGAGNARYVQKHFLGNGPVRGPKAALSAMHVVSMVTETDFEEEDTGTGHVKRLHHCEFESAFKDRGEFPRAMMCMLHKAAYQGSVNGLVKEGEPGFDVQLLRRILFGDNTCDFLVVPRGEVAPDDDALPIAHTPDKDEQEDLAYYFYTFLLTSFVDYLTHHLPAPEVEGMMRAAARKVGHDISGLLPGLGIGPGDRAGLARAVLLLGGRELDGETLHVKACPQADHIRSTASGEDDSAKDRVRANACRLCKHVVSGVVETADPDATVHRSTSLALGDAGCDYEVSD